MPYLNNQDFLAVQTALKAANGMIENALPKFDWGKSALDGDAIQSLNETPALVSNALKLVDDAVLGAAEPGLRDLAHELYGSDDVEIDDEGVGTSEGEDGVWVQAWVWVSDAEREEAGLKEAEDDDDGG